MAKAKTLLIPEIGQTWTNPGFGAMVTDIIRHADNDVTIGIRRLDVDKTTAKLSLETFHSLFPRRV